MIKSITLSLKLPFIKQHHKNVPKSVAIEKLGANMCHMYTK